MRVLFLSHYFPPEVNAPASRTFEHARRWARRPGVDITVITNHPHHPHGRLYPGHRNRWLSRQEVDGVSVRRVWSYLAPNAGVARRLANYLIFALLAFWRGLREPRPDVVVATSPQFFCALAGWAVAFVRRRPFVFELRDLWPESVATVGAMKKGLLLRLAERLELFLYRRAALVVAVTDAFKANLVARGIDPAKIKVLTNGADLAFWTPRPRPAELERRLGLAGKTVAAYIGTLGMAHDLDTVLAAAAELRGRDHIAFLLIGDGARRAELLERARELGLGNLAILPQTPKEKVPDYYALADILMVTLRDDPLFRTVLPSKVFEIMAMGRPMVYTVDGQCRALVERAGAGVFSLPGRPKALAEALASLAGRPELRREMGARGRRFVEANYDRDRLAERYLNLLRKAASGTGD